MERCRPAPTEELPPAARRARERPGRRVGTPVRPGKVARAAMVAPAPPVVREPAGLAGRRARAARPVPVARRARAARPALVARWGPAARPAVGVAVRPAAAAQRGAGVRPAPVAWRAWADLPRA